MSLISYKFAKKHQIVLDTSSDKPCLYFTGTLNPAVLQEIQQSIQSPFSLTAIDQKAFHKKLETIYQGQNSDTSEAVAALSDELDLDSFREQFSKAQDLLEENDDAPIIRIINTLLSKAIKEKASDIHIESFEHRIAIRFRVDGVLQGIMQPPVELAPFLISRVKIMAGLDIAEKRLPQDGRISTQIAGRTVDIRVSTLPVAKSERIVLRILDKDTINFSLSEIDIDQSIKEKIKTIIHQPHGIFLVVGPTGSGKTTTLYASLSDLDILHKNVMTIEDPIEYFLDGISQTQVNHKSGMSFAKGLRSILRQDPDVIMIGEIRDLETAQIAVQSSLTGHTVFSTLHTNTAIGAITRLQDMGIEPFLISSSLNGILSQRLVRTLCSHCKEKMNPTAASIKILGEDIDYYRPVGCNQCANLGYHGRIGIYELIEVDNTLKNLINQNAPEQEMESHIRQFSQSIFVNAAELVKTGRTSLEEIMRVAI